VVVFGSDATPDGLPGEGLVEAVQLEDGVILVAAPADL
jgi:hypothetical protein